MTEFDWIMLIICGGLFASHLIVLGIGFWMGTQGRKTRFVQAAPIYPTDKDIGFNPGPHDLPMEDGFEEARGDEGYVPVPEEERERIPTVPGDDG